MNKYIEKAIMLLFAKNEIYLEDLEKCLYYAMGPGIDYADVFFQRTWGESLLESNGKITASYYIDGGVGIRSLAKDKTGFAYSNEISFKNLKELGNITSSIIKKGSSNKISINKYNDNLKFYSEINPILKTNLYDKIDIIKKIENLAYLLDPAIIKVNVSLKSFFDVILIKSSDGILNSDIRPLIQFYISVIAERNFIRASGNAIFSGRFNFSEFKIKNYVKRAVHQALINLDAINTPIGQLPVVLGNGNPGVLIHESIGHGLEGDFNRKGNSIFYNKIRKQVAAKGVTIVDNSTINNLSGSLSIDDEGTPGQNTLLIDDGILINYMNDKLNSRLMGMKSTGNARRQSYSFLPIPRMTNTYMLNGDSKPEEIIKSVKRGIYAVSFEGGQVDITSGKFVFSTNEAYMIEDGKITFPVKCVTLIGDALNVMQNISMIGDDIAFDSGICVKNGQYIHVNVGQPTIKVDNLTIGGTQF
ncbi:Protein TldD [Candidatus Johnevansia muelleri]|uniref:Protein TldD n=1 Tax=Candidatus Johnevansia muelleri TaxID=1495769 RepID=A0A078KI63_9GAMM|nr:Protein TldD [Candidatus Evansia muelleri]